MKKVSILIPTCDRAYGLIATLTGIISQTYRDYDVIISDQSYGDEVLENKTLQAIYRVMSSQGNETFINKNLPRLGLAQQRDFLLNRSKSKFSLYVDDDLILKPFVVENMVNTIEEDGCGFVGSAPIGLGYTHVHRPWQERIELWDGKVGPEKIVPGDKNWQRAELHNAANLYHVEDRLQVTPASPKKYKVAWIGACVMYDTQKLRDVGGFEFWRQLPIEHCGEDAFVQIRMIEKYGGCGLIPSGVFHQELPTTVVDRKVNAPEFLIDREGTE